MWWPSDGRDLFYIRENVRHGTTRARIRLPPRSRCPARGDSDCPPPPSFARLVGGRAMARARSRLAISRALSLARLLRVDSLLHSVDDLLRARRVIALVVAHRRLGVHELARDRHLEVACRARVVHLLDRNVLTELARQRRGECGEVLLVPSSAAVLDRDAHRRVSHCCCVCVEECEAPSAETARRFLSLETLYMTVTGPVSRPRRRFAEGGRSGQIKHPRAPSPRPLSRAPAAHVLFLDAAPTECRRRSVRERERTSSRGARKRTPKSAGHPPMSETRHCS